MKSYRFSVGNTPDNELGLVARVTASSKRKACEILNARLDSESAFELPSNDTRIEYLNIYPNRLLVRPSDIVEINDDA